MTKEYLLTKAHKKHSNNGELIYDYSLVNNHIAGESLIKLICKKHGKFTVKVSQHLYKYGCQKCGLESRAAVHQYNQNEIIYLFYEKWGKESFDYSLIEYLHSKKKVKIICNKCKNIFEQKPNDHLSGYGCPVCNTIGNVSEPKLYEFIKSHFPNEKIKRRVKLNWLFNVETKRHQSLDVYFSEYNIAVEYQGGQHFKPVNFWGGIERFNIVKERDERKRLLCIKNECKLLYFTYNKKDVPLNYPHKIFTDENILLNEIKRIIITKLNH